MKEQYKYDNKAVVNYNIETLKMFFNDYLNNKDSIQRTCLYAANEGKLGQRNFLFFRISLSTKLC